jgi:hypoxanthine phosphoribosyltransferase
LPQPQLLLSAEEIGSAVQRLARDTVDDYRSKNPLLVGVLKGCFVFMADLIRHLDMPLEVEFLRLSSYGPGRTRSRGSVRALSGLRIPVDGRHVLVVEDIVDTGLTLRFTLDYLKRRGPASLKVCALFDKPARRQTEVPLDYRGFVVPDVFVVGYGLDYDERFRQLPGLYSLQEEP